MQFGRNIIGEFLGPDNDIIMNAISRGEIWDAQVLDLLTDYGDSQHFSTQLALDIGANIGQFTIAFAQRFAHVVAFEPDAFLRTILESNITLNDCKNVEIRQEAVWKESGVQLPFPEPDGRYASLGSYGIRPDLKSPRMVVSLSIDDLHLNNVGFVKIDIQGSDLNAMLGMRNTIDLCRPIICFEYEPEMAIYFNQDFQDYLDFIESIGYEVVAVKNHDFLIGPRKS